MKRAVLLLNMGGPNNLDEVEVFLNNMFNDKRIIAAPKIIRYLLAKFITFRRKDQAKANYAYLGGKSPIIGYTQELVTKLEEVLEDATVHMVMRYTPPYAFDVLQDLYTVDEIYAIPLYPHHSSTTTLSSLDDLREAMHTLQIKAKLITIDAYYKQPNYIQAVLERIQETLGQDDPSSYELVFSAHGLPKNIIDKGDLYQKHIKSSVYYVRKALVQANIDFYKTHLAYQSRLGPLEWIRPYLDEKLGSLEKTKVILVPIAFTIDNSETEFELEVEYREIAQKLGFEIYKVAKAPNAHREFVSCLANIYTAMKGA